MLYLPAGAGRMIASPGRPADPVNPEAVHTVTRAELGSAPPADLAARLEGGAIVRFEPGALPLPSEEDQRFLRERLGELISLKNVSYHPRGRYLSGLKGAGPERERTLGILADHHAAVEAFLAPLLPRYAAAWSRGKVNFRPLQERGRNLSRHSSNELLHVDAFASGATHGGRTLRFFTNIHPTESRVWKSAGLFPELYQEFGERAGIRPLGGSGLREGPLDRTLSGFLRTLAGLGLPQALTVDSSPYDRAMKRMHDALKDDPAFQADEARFERFEFDPGSSWMVLTDMVSHACISGQHALVCTWTVPPRAQVRPELSPWAVMDATARG